MSSPTTYSRLVKWVWIGLSVATIGSILFFWSVSVNLFGLYGPFPSTDKLLNPKSELATVIISDDGKEIGKYFRENRTPVKYKDLSQELINALKATEDIRFEQHSGIDMLGVLGLFWSAVQGKPRGGSTISQQLAKNLFNTRSEAYEGHLSNIKGLKMLVIKAKEWIVAVRLERAYTKEEIMTMYLNTVHFGSNAYGIKVAAKTFFNTEPNRLTAVQAALLVGMLKGPTQYSPITRKERALERRNVVLEQMHKYDFLSEADLEALKVQPLGINYRVESHNEGGATYFRAEIRKELVDFCKSNNLDLYSDGLKVYVTINSKIQQYAEAAIERHMKKQQADFDKYWAGRNPWCDEDGKEIPNFIDNAVKRSQRYRGLLSELGGDEKAAQKIMNTPVEMDVFTWDSPTYAKRVKMSPRDSIAYYKRFLHAGLMSVDPKSGYIRAWVGGVNFRFFKYDHVRQGKRQPGSSFKPILYAACVENGYGPCHEMVDAPVTFVNDMGQSWTPKNSDGNYSGERMTLRKAMAQSINSVAAGMLKLVNIGPVVEMAKRLGIQSTIDPVPPLILGSSDVSLYELVGAYATFVNHGTYTKPFFIKRIEDKNGNKLREFVPERKDAIGPDVAYTMVHMLKGATTERNGTALGLYRLGNTLRGNEVGAKTGTTSNYSDGWFIGCTKDLVTGIWVGGDDRSIHFRSSNYGQGARMAMPIWSYFMDAVYEDQSTGVTKGPFERPQSLDLNFNCNELKLRGSANDTSRTKVYEAPKTNDLKDEF